MKLLYVRDFVILMQKLYWAQMFMDGGGFLVVGARETWHLLSPICIPFARAPLGARRKHRGSDGDWKNVWKLDVPPKVHVFWWRVLHDFLLAWHNIFKMHIEWIANYEICGAPEQTIKHVLLECFMQEGYGSWLRTSLVWRFLVCAWARDLLQPHICSKRDTTIIICGMWSLWTSRKKRRYRENRSQSGELWIELVIRCMTSGVCCI